MESTIRKVSRKVDRIDRLDSNRGSMIDQRNHRRELMLDNDDYIVRNDSALNRKPSMRANLIRMTVRQSFKEIRRFRT